MVVDLPDIGSRYYTFAWTMSLTIQACGELSIPVLVLDRPNPINGVDTEGPILDPSLSSFVGLLPVRARHGMTLGEIARLARDSFNIKSPVEVIQTENWDRNDYLEQTGAPWMLPSPNMPTVDTAVVYPGACLIEATNLSEGRGTSRPFEIIGAPFLDGWKIATALNSLALPGVHFQPIQFMPTFNKHEGILCEGVFVHVLERRVFKPWITYVAIIQESIRQTGLHKSLPALAETFIANSEETRLPGFAWKLPPYEYEFNNAPIDILLGVHGLSNQIENLVALSDIEERSQYS